MFKIGSNWIGIAIVIGSIGGIMLLQGVYEQGNEWARTAQWILGVGFIGFIGWVAYKTK